MCRRDNGSAWGQFFQFEPAEKVPFFIKATEVQSAPRARLTVEAFEPEEFRIAFTRAEDQSRTNRAGAAN